MSGDAFGFIGSYGTFSWSIAYMNKESNRILMPYMKHMPDPGWTPWCELFIDDDECIRYVDLHTRE